MNDSTITVLEVLPDEADHRTDEMENIEDAVIEDNEDGVPVINVDVVKPNNESESNIDKNFKDLVDSVLK
jgi:hypothetical protein